MDTTKFTLAEKFKSLSLSDVPLVEQVEFENLEKFLNDIESNIEAKKSTLLSLQNVIIKYRAVTQELVAAAFFEEREQLIQDCKAKEVTLEERIGTLQIEIGKLELNHSKEKEKLQSVILDMLKKVEQK